jgi:hypothetical protein
MGVLPRTFRLVAGACLSVAVAGSAYGQPAGSDFVLSEPNALTRFAADGPADPREPRASYGEAFARPFTSFSAQARSRGMSPAAKGALIGGGAAALVTAAAASEYGKNEGGRFCGTCFVRWSAFTVPVGAGVGALIGLGIDRARRPVTAMPLLSPSTAGLVVTARF